MQHSRRIAGVSLCEMHAICCAVLQVSNQIGNLMDIYPTVVEMADLKLPKGVFFDGHSLADVMFGANKTHRLALASLSVIVVYRSFTYLCLKF